MNRLALNCSSGEPIKHLRDCTQCLKCSAMTRSEVQHLKLQKAFNTLKTSKTLYLDFEFCQITSRNVKLVSCATFDPISGRSIDFWLHNDDNKQKILKEYLQKFDTIIAYSAVAEARSYLSLVLDPLKFKWIDLYLEYRMLLNHNDNLQWGPQLVRGKVKTVHKPPPKWERTERDKYTSFKPTFSLAEATFKLTGEIRDTEHKKAMRDLIISNPDTFSSEERQAILDYGREDVKHLPEIWKRIQEEFFSLFPERSKPKKSDYIKEAILRGRYAAHTAIMESRGYPIDIEKTRNFSNHVSEIIWDTQKEINDLFPAVKPFKWNKKEQRFSWDQGATKRWIKENHSVEDWMKTDGKGLSLSLDAFQKFYDFKHTYPTDNFGAQMVRFLKLKQSLYGFAPSSASDSSRKTFWDSVGPDGRVRPYMNIFGAQSSRSQPAATGFMFLKPAWMRALVQPAKGHFIASIDYASQEFLTAGIESNDRVMIESYLSGDPYFAFAKLSGQVPKDGKLEDNRDIRNACKSTVLAIQFLMTKYGLAIKLTNDTGRPWTEDEAQEQIDLFNETYEDFHAYREEIKEDYAGGGGGLRLPCGWYVFGDNPNVRSICNVPIQGYGASVMRLAVHYAQSIGIAVLFTLHDAIYIEGKVGEEWKVKKLRDLMVAAYAYYADDSMKKYAKQIRTDPFIWGPDYPKDGVMDIDGYRVDCSNLYIDSRAAVDYEKFSKYFVKPDWDIL